MVRKSKPAQTTGWMSIAQWQQQAAAQRGAAAAQPTFSLRACQQAQRLPDALGIHKLTVSQPQEPAVAGTMPQRGLHPLLHTVRVVMRNGASFTMQSTMRRTTPYVLQHDTTNNPVYTGESAGLSLEDERMQKLMSKYGGFLREGQDEQAAAGSGAAPAAKAAAAAAAAAAKGKKGKKK
ncbi:hypothetical protein ABPG75_007202 [Micractinium tetrahymenae]